MTLIILHQRFFVDFGFLKKPDQLQRSLFQRLKPDKLALGQLTIAPCISKEVRSYQRNQGVQRMNNENNLRRQILW